MKKCVKNVDSIFLAPRGFVFTDIISKIEKLIIFLSRFLFSLNNFQRFRAIRYML